MRYASYLFLALLTGCMQPQAITSIGIDASGNFSGNAVRIEVYLSEGTSENTCAKFIEFPSSKPEVGPSLVYNSLAEFESQGFATIQIDHVPAWKKMLLLIVAVDPNSEQIIANACAENIEVEKGSVRDVHLELSSISSRGDS